MAAPVAGIGWSAVSSPIKVGDLVSFTDLSTDNPDYWEWDFDNSGTVDSYLQNPTYRYSQPGIYSVKLYVSNVDGESTLVLTSEITVVAASTVPSANFVGTPLRGPLPLTVTFTDTSTGTPTSWAWDFDNSGGAADSLVQNPTKTYSQAGTYDVKLTVSNSAGSNSTVKQAYVIVEPAVPIAPVANFTTTPSSGTVPLTVRFTDTSTGIPTGWSWDFNNDGVYDNDTDQNPTYTYTEPGVYTAKLRASNSLGFSTVTKTVTVSSPTLVANFTATPLTGSVPLSVTFTDTSTGPNPITAWSWDFTNNGSEDSTSQNPTTSYSRAGRYSVRLTVTSGLVTASVVKELYITVTPVGSTGNLTVAQGTSSDTTAFVRDSLAAFYDPDRNYLRYGKVTSVTFLSNPSFKIVHKADYVPRINLLSTDLENYSNRRVLSSVTDRTIDVSTTVSAAFAAQGVSAVPGTVTSKVLVNGGLAGGGVESTYAVGTLVSALITGKNVIVLGRISAIRYVNSNPAGTPNQGYFLYSIKSWTKSPNSPTLRTYTTKESFVKDPTVSISTLSALGKIPIRPKSNLVIRPFVIGSGAAVGSTAYDPVPKTYNITLTAEGGTAPYYFDIVSGSIMTGCSLSESGLISGTATVAGTYSFTVRVTDSNVENPSEGYRSYQINLVETPDPGDPGGGGGGGP